MVKLPAAIAELGIDIDTGPSGFGRIASTASSFVGSLLVKYFHSAVCFVIVMSIKVMDLILLIAIKLFVANYEKIFSKTYLYFQIFQK